MINEKAVEQLKKEGYIEQPVHASIRLKIKDVVFRPGVVRVMLPVPINAEQLYEGQLLDFDPMFRMVSVEDYPQRTAYYYEKTDENISFYIEFAFENRMKYIQVNTDVADNCEQKGFSKEQLDSFMSNHHCGCESYTGLARDAVSIMDLAPEDYIVFTDDKYDFLCEKGFLQKMASGYAVSDVYRDKAGTLAKKLFDLVCSDSYPWKANDLAAELVTLCRMCMLPSRWQGGILGAIDGSDKPKVHSIALVHLDPYGWIFVDMINAKASDDLFFFGNTDPGFIPTGSRFGGSMYPAKDYDRADEYYNVYGEVEMVPFEAEEGYGLKKGDFITEIKYLN